MDNVVIYHGYPVSIVAAISFHCLVLAAIIYFQSNSRPETFNLVQPTVVKALLVEVNPQLRNAQNLERQRLERLEQQRQTRQQEIDLQAEADRQLERERVAEQERVQAQEQQRQRDDARRQQQDEVDRQTRAEAERRRQEQAQVQQRELEQQRQRDLAREQESQRQQAAAELATTEFELVQSATALIQQVVEENWSRPPSARNGMRAILQISILPTGELVSTSITQSSGDAAFDRSAENAVFKAAPFRELQILPINLFNTNFRILSLIFEPEDLLN
jgi:colicin import membrane protein